jgi:hypothetical protein
MDHLAHFLQDFEVVKSPQKITHIFALPQISDVFFPYSFRTTQAAEEKSFDLKRGFYTGNVVKCGMAKSGLLHFLGVSLQTENPANYNYKGVKMDIFLGNGTAYTIPNSIQYSFS